MAHEVVKRVGKRAYRYRVESYRDPSTRKVRSRWTYLGTAGDVAGAGGDATGELSAVVRRAPARTRDRLVDAVERLLATHSYADVTAGMVATEAGLAHGTFYRHFKDKRDVFMAALTRVREQFDRERPTFDPPFGSVSEERARVRGCLSLDKPAEFPGLLRAYFELLESDEALREERERRRAERVDRFATYLELLAANGTIAAENPRSLATALLALADAVVRDAALARSAVDRRTIEGVESVFDRAIFGPEANG
jgi:AcrR family transcriptional regulator